MSFLIQTSSDQRSFASFPRLIAGYHVFRRLSMPRHPPCTLSSLTTFIDHRPYPGRASPYERPTTDQINPDGLSIRLASMAEATPARRPTSDNRQKGARRSSGQDRKDQWSEKTTAYAGGLGPRTPNTSRRIAVYRDLHAGGYLRQASQNLLLNLYSLVKEHMISQARRMRGRRSSN